MANPFSEPTIIGTDDDLFHLFQIMRARGWQAGGVNVGNDHAGEGAQSILILEMSAPADGFIDGDLDSAKGVRRLTARVGDWQVPFGLAVNVMTPELYAATYGDN